MSRLVDLYACGLCNTVRTMPITDLKEGQPTTAYCYVCKARRDFLAVLVKVTHTGKVIVETS